MTSIDITFINQDEQKTKLEFATALPAMIKLKSQSFSVLYNFILGTENTEWLKDAEKTETLN